MQSQGITVGYWNIRGLAAPLRMMVLYGQATLINVAYDNPYEGPSSIRWFETEKPALKEKNPLINLPYVIDGDIVVTQTNACLSYVGKKLGLWGRSLVEEIRCEEYLCEIMDVRNRVIGFSYSSASDIEARASALFAGLASGSLAKLETVLANNNTEGESCFLIGSAATAPDFHLWEMLDQCDRIATFTKLPSVLKSFSSLKTFHEKFASLPGNARYFNSRLANLPCNNKSAKSFGATPSGDLFVLGQEYDWKDSDVVI